MEKPEQTARKNTDKDVLAEIFKCIRNHYTQNEISATMTDERYAEADKTGQLTEQEVTDGWHFCLELDGALVNHIGLGIEWCKCLGDK